MGYCEKPEEALRCSRKVATGIWPKPQTRPRRAVGWSLSRIASGTFRMYCHFQFGLWGSLVSRLPWAEKIVGSNPAGPTCIADSDVQQGPYANGRLAPLQGAGAGSIPAGSTNGSTGSNATSMLELVGAC